MGVAVGALVIDQTLAVVSILVVAFLTEPALGALDQRAAAFAPVNAAAALAGSQTIDSRLAPVAGAGVLVLYGLVLGPAAAASLRRRGSPDVACLG